MTILVTGGAGFIGSQLVEKLLLQRHEVICLDNFDDFYDVKIKLQNITAASVQSNYDLVEGDIRDASALQECFNRKKVDIVVHLAARAGVRPSIQQPELYYDVNVIGTLRLLEAMRTSGVKKLVFGSSSSVYGNNPKVPFTESDPVDNPISPYAATKKAAELLCHTYHKLYDFDIFCLRFFTVYGPRQRPEMAIHQFVRNIVDGNPITMYGDGSTLRDYTYVDDILQGVLAAIQNVRGYEILNLGESRTIALKNLIALLEERIGKKAIIRQLPEQLGDVKLTNADISKARRLIGYNPKVPIEDGLSLFVKWFSERQGVH